MLEPVPARPEVAVVEQGGLHTASLAAGRHLMHVHRLHPGDGVPHQVDETCLRNELCYPLGNAAVDVGPRVARRALPGCGGPVCAVEEGLVPAATARPVLLSHEEVRLAESRAVPNEDIGMLSEIVMQTHRPRLHRLDYQEVRQGHRVVTAINVLFAAGIGAGYTFSARPIRQAQSVFTAHSANRSVPRL